MHLTDRQFLVRTAAMDRAAFGQDSVDFVRWVLLRNERMTSQEVQLVLERAGVEMLGGDKSSGALRVGESVVCKAERNLNPLNTEPCQQWDNTQGYVHEVSQGDTVVMFGKTLVRFHGDTPGQATGIYRQQVASKARTLLEVVYIKDPTAVVSLDRQQMINQYIEKGLQAGESRQDIYYSGPVNKMAMGKDGMYFTMPSQQRSFENSAAWRAFNPSKGRVLYIGPLGRRPGGWKADLMQREQAALKSNPDYLV